MKVVYQGKFDVTLMDLGEGRIKIERGKEIEVSDGIGRILVEQGIFEEVKEQELKRMIVEEIEAEKPKKKKKKSKQEGLTNGD